jgi:hypothetical protein
MTLRMFCNFMFNSDELREAHAIITAAHRWTDKKSAVHHEFLVVDAEMDGSKFWVRIDRSRKDKGGATLRWEAHDTVHEISGAYKSTR